MKATDKTAALFDVVFPQDRRWNKWFFDHVSHPEMRIETFDPGKDELLASLHLMPYRMMFHGSALPVSYIFGAMTAPSHRGKGLMSRLMVSALNASREKGDAFCCLIPAQRHLYFFYDRFGFSTVFYIREQRYTAVHRFDIGEGYLECEPVYETVSMLEMLAGNMVLHDKAAFDSVINDLHHSEGEVTVAQGPEGSLALAAFVCQGGEVRVRMLLATDPTAHETVLAYVRERHPELPIVVEALPGPSSRGLEARGMIRLLDAQKVLGALAASHPHMKLNIRLTDDLLPDNSGLYMIDAGVCVKCTAAGIKPDLDVTSEVLAAVLFSCPEIGSVFKVPSERPFMALMYD